MEKSDFEIVLDAVAKNPNATGRDLSNWLKKNGNDRFVPKLTNQILYRLLASEIVCRDGSQDKPRWSIGETWTKGIDPSDKQLANVRPLSQNVREILHYKIASTEVRVIFEDDLSSNDPYMCPDWVGSHVVAAINTNHPFWTLRAATESDKSLFSMVIALDAYIQWKTAQLNEPPDSTEILKMRDAALRFCTLMDLEVIKTD